MICLQCLSRCQAFGPSRRGVRVLLRSTPTTARRRAGAVALPLAPERSLTSSPPALSSSSGAEGASAAPEGGWTMKRTTKATRRAAPKVVSSLPAGARIRGLGYLKDRDDPVAEEDGDYPEWLWNCLSALPSSAKEHDDQEGSTASTLTRAAAKKAARKKLKAKAESGPAEVPLVEQSIDLPSNPAGDLAGAVEALNARAALTKAMRVERRKEIKESNYLKGMR